MNQLILNLAEQGYTQVVYLGFHALGFITVIIFNLWYCHFYEIKKSQAMILTVSTYLIAYFWIYVLAWVENQFSNWGANNIVRGYIWFPLIAMIPNIFLKIDSRKATDFMAPCCALVHGVSHIGCIFAGCCHGFPCDWGIYNHNFMQTLFPTQLLESAVAFAIVFFCMWLAKKEQYVGSGKIFPAFLISFGSTRFFLEFLRDNEKIIGSISVLSLHALLMIIVGVIWLLVLKKVDKRKSE